MTEAVLLVLSRPHSALDDEIRSFRQRAAELGELVNRTTRCHSVRLCHSPSVFLQDSLVATESVAMSVPVLVWWTSAWRPLKPMIVSW